MLKKIISAILVMGMAFGMPFTAFCESTVDNINSAFKLGGENSVEVTTSVNASYTYVRNYGTVVAPIALEDDLFEEAYPYQCYGGGPNNRWDNIYKMKFDIPEADANDCVWLSYYYKSASSFVGGNGNTYTGATISVPQQRNTANEIVPNLKAGAYGDTFVADDKWHRVDLYMKASNISGDELSIYFTDMSDSVYVLFAGFRAGVVDFYDDAYNNDRAYTELGWHLQNAEAGEIILNGKSVVLADGVYEYNISAEEDELELSLPIGTNLGISKVEKKSVGCYEVEITAPGYSVSGDDTTLRRRVNAATGEFSSIGAIETYVVKNSDMVRKYIINLALKSVEATMIIDGEDKTILDGCIGGEMISVDVKYRNLKSEDKTYMTLLMLYENGILKSVMPARKNITSEQAEARDTYTYILPAGDYTGYTADFLVIDTDTMCDVAK